MRATKAFFDVLSFVGAAISPKTIETMPGSRKSGPNLAARFPGLDDSAGPLGYTHLWDEREADAGGSRRDVLCRRCDLGSDRLEMDGADRPRPLRRAAPLHRTGARVPRHQPPDALRAAAHAGGAGHLPPRQLSRVAAACRVRTDRQGPLDAADHRGDADVRARVADPGSRPRSRGSRPDPRRLTARPVARATTRSQSRGCAAG